MTVPIPVAMAIAEYSRQWPSLALSPENATDACFLHSEAFANLLREYQQEDVEVVSGVHMDVPNRIILAGHAATRVGDVVIDWTLHQFYPDAHCPTITPYAEWRDDWKPLKEATA